jgi:hypothetical protein
MSYLQEESKIQCDWEMESWLVNMIGNHGVTIPLCQESSPRINKQYSQ